MSEDNFLFEYKENDEVEFHGGKWIVSGESIGGGWVISYNGYSVEVLPHEIKPVGAAKKRYKAEKLAWKQSRIKAGDWVGFVSCGCFKPFRVSEIGTHIDFGAFGIDEHGVGYPVCHLMPCKPPKPEVGLVKFNFKIENGKMLLNGDSIGDVRDSCILRLKSEGGWIPVDADEIRQIADALESDK